MRDQKLGMKMNTKKTATLSDEDSKRRAFSPIQMDLVERLTREADTRTGRPATTTERKGDASKLAA